MSDINHYISDALFLKRLIDREGQIMKYTSTWHDDCVFVGHNSHAPLVTCVINRPSRFLWAQFSLEITRNMAGTVVLAVQP